MNVIADFEVYRRKTGVEQMSLEMSSSTFETEVLYRVHLDALLYHSC